MNPFQINDIITAVVVLGVLFAVANKKWRAAVLTFMAVYGIVFAESLHPIIGLVYIFLSFSTLIIAWLFGRLISKKKDPKESLAAFVVAVIMAFVPLFLFKLAMAVVPMHIIKAIQQNAPAFDFSLLLPVGISYFSFRSVAYLIEIRRKTISPVSFFRFVNYAFFWPTLLAGPIERPGRFLRQSEKMEKATRLDIAIGFSRIITGFVKKTVLAAFFAGVARPYLELGAYTGSTQHTEFIAHLEAFSTPYLWLCVTAYYFYLYLDFSAYSDLAIGLSRMMGFKIMENFRWPILALNVSEFWQRWHISLTSWITDYVYRPLGGNRKGLLSAGIFTLTAMALVGAWHGMNLHFIAWGLYHAIFLILYRQWRKSWKKKIMPEKSSSPKCVSTFAAWFITFQVVNVGWVLFNFPIGKSILIWLKLIWVG